MKYNKIIFTILASLIPILIFGQKISYSTNYELVTTNKINKIYDTHLLNNQTVLLADTREPNDLDVLLLCIDKKGKVIKEKRFGEAGYFERPVSLCTKKDGYYLLINRSKNGKAKLVLYHLDNNYDILKEAEIFVPNLEVGTQMIVKNETNIIIVATTLDQAFNSYPVVLEYNVNTRERLWSTELDKNDKDPNETNMVNMMEIDENGKMKKVGQMRVRATSALTKACNQIRCVGEDCSELILVGFVETTKTITDFWVAKLKNGQIEWEKKYVTKVGGDEAYDVFPLESGQYLVTGLEYTKTLEENYSFRTLLLNESGELESSINHRDASKRRTMYRDAKPFGKDVLMLGYSENVEYRRGEADIITKADISLVLTNKKGEKITEYFHTTEPNEKASTLVVFPDNTIHVFYESEGKVGIMELGINP